MKYAEKLVRAKKLLPKLHTKIHFWGTFKDKDERTTTLATAGAQIVDLGQTWVFWISTGAMFWVY